MNVSGYKRIPQAKRIEIAVEMEQRSETGRSVSDIARKYKVTANHCYRLEKKHKIDPDMNDDDRSGRPLKVTPTMERRIIRETLKNPFESSLKLVKTINEGLGEKERISARTLRLYTFINGMKCCRPAIKPSLKPEHIEDRLNFAKRYVHKDMRFWSHVLFTDETKVELHPKDMRDRVRRPRHRRNDDKYILRSHSYGGGNLMFWGSIHFKGVGELYCIEESLDAKGYTELLAEVIPEIKRKLNIRSFCLQDDNSSVHRAEVVTRYKDKESIRSFENCPARSPDLNPIETLWAIWKQRIRDKAPRDLEQLKIVALQEWTNISQDLIKKLYRSMPKRLGEVMRVQGRNTRY